MHTCVNTVCSYDPGTSTLGPLKASAVAASVFESCLGSDASFDNAEKTHKRQRRLAAGEEDSGARVFKN